MSNKELLNNKIKEPSRSVELISVQEQLSQLQTLIDNANIEIRKHNSVVDNLDTEKKELIQDVWKFFVESNKTAIETYLKKLNGLQKGIDSLKQQREDLLKNTQKKTMD